MVLGPGGSGISVVAAAGALRRERGRPPSRAPLSRPGRHTLLITIDRLSPTPDLLGVFRLPGSTVAVSSGVHLLTLERLQSVEQTWSAFAGLLTAGIRDTKLNLPMLGTLAGIESAELATLPGVEEFLLLRRIRDEAVSGSWERIVVDLSGVADAFALLRAPSFLEQGIERLWPRHRRLAAATERPVLAQLAAAIDTIARDCEDIAEVLSDPHVLAGHLVVAADARGARAVAQHLALADLMGFPLRSVLVNRGVRAGEPAEVHIKDRHVVIRMVEAAAAPLDRPARLRKLAVTLAEPTGDARGSGAAQVRTVCGTGLDTIFEMSWEQRLPDPQRFDLGRSGDDLLVTVDGYRHAVRLPSVLRRCDVVEASWDGRSVRVRFAPDPAVWPRGQ
ncbi:ArsA-related P-loop ATPase [Gordonia sp. DT219]|uniref:ArsA-related P-loop ATPase n=1 Tax=Gordonia sp. DT219 TaxID=3416658 RepID=UPI003CED4299